MLAKTVGKYLRSQTVTNAVENILEKKTGLKKKDIQQILFKVKIKIWTAQKWLK